MTPSTITTSRHGDHVLVITIDRPERRNAFDRATAEAMEVVIDDYEADPSLWVAVITGADGMFSAGLDLKAAAQGEYAVTDKRGAFGIMQQPPGKPLIAAIEGHALAGGLELALSCDLIVAADNAMMGLPEVKWGLIAAGGGLFRLPKRIPYHVAMELVLTGTPRPASDFLEWGLVNRTSEPGTALDTALGLAEELLAGGPLALAASAQIMRQAVAWSDEEGWALQQPDVERVFSSRDQAEGLAAFAEKRAPKWTNS